MNVVDSCGWLEYLGDGANAGFFAAALEDTDNLIVPTLSIHEVYKKVLAERGEADALQTVALMQQGVVEELTVHMALEGARVSAELGLPMADGIILATARVREATLWTQDVDFDGVEGVRYVSRRLKD
ncbi:MAG: type II toxin-antitoxin system VapC family toxin [Coriobacteriia bacterium]|nr:type II toxin-antitoxin system VapC family toxin [Coriobacteriia bacterium]